MTYVKAEAATTKKNSTGLSGQRRMQHQENIRGKRLALPGLGILLRMVAVLAIAALGLIGQPTLASDRATTAECSAMASHFGSALQIGTGKSESSAKGLHASHPLACPAVGCLLAFFAESTLPQAFEVIEVSVIVRLDRADCAGQAVSPGYRPPIEG